ncbi:hypothetical protein MJM95_27955, partial [Salmonella enterica subsp. enterica serovar Anatum]|nr:hypothetical protein [Salmonella enterica subsp. enterica serovar Anatum]
MGIITPLMTIILHNLIDFIKAASGGALLLGAAPSVSHAAAENRPPIPGSLGMLYDSTL